MHQRFPDNREACALSCLVILRPQAVRLIKPWPYRNAAEGTPLAAYPPLKTSPVVKCELNMQAMDVRPVALNKKFWPYGSKASSKPQVPRTLLPETANFPTANGNEPASTSS